MKAVYKIENTESGKCYIGSSIDVESRLLNHKSRLKHNNHSISDIQTDFNNNAKAFRFEVIEEFPDDTPTSVLRYSEHKYLQSIPLKNRYNRQQIVAVTKLPRPYSSMYSRPFFTEVYNKFKRNKYSYEKGVEYRDKVYAYIEELHSMSYIALSHLKSLLREDIYFLDNLNYMWFRDLYRQRGLYLTWDDEDIIDDKTYQKDLNWADTFFDILLEN